MPCKRLSDEVYYGEDATLAVGDRDIGDLAKLAAGNARRRVRLCAHTGVDDRLHEMLVVLGKGSYVRPHKHVGKSESFHAIRGRADVVICDDAGQVVRVVALGAYGSGQMFYLRMNLPEYHTVLVRSDEFVFHEVTNGPFDRADTLFAPWSPAEDDVPGIVRFMAELEAALSQLASH